MKSTPKDMRKIIKVLLLAAEELKRLRYLHAPRYDGKLGEPDPEVIREVEKALND